MRRFLWDGEVIPKERAEAAGQAVDSDGGGWASGRVLRPAPPGLRDGVEILYGFAPSHWGRGFAPEATGATLGYGFEEAGLYRILGVVDKENVASRRVLEKIGMTFNEEACYSAAREEYRPPPLAGRARPSGAPG